MLSSFLNFIVQAFRRELVDVYPDTMVVDRKTLHSRIPEWLRSSSKTDLTLILTHFQSTFLAVQDVLDSAGIDYEIGPRNLGGQFFREQASLKGTVGSDKEHKKAPVVLALSAQLDLENLQTIKEEKQAAPVDALPHLSVLVPEFHPYDRINKQSLEFCRSLGIRVDVGFFVALDDLIVKKFLDERVVMLMEDMGIKDEEVSSSIFFFGHLRKRLKFYREDRMASIDAASDKDWFAHWDESHER